MPTGFNLYPFGTPALVTPLLALVKIAVRSVSTRPFSRTTIVPGVGTATVFGANIVLLRPAAAPPDGVLAMPQELLLLLSAGPAPYLAIYCPCVGFGCGTPVCARVVPAVSIAALAISKVRTSKSFFACSAWAE